MYYTTHHFSVINILNVLSNVTGEVENLDKLVKKCLLDSFKQTDEDFLKKASSQ